MPELPEVETIVCELRPHLVGRTIVSVKVDWAKTIDEPKQDIPRFSLGVIGRQVVGVWRRGKFVVIRLDDGMSLVIHLRMSGRLLLKARGPSKHLRVLFAFSDGSHLYFYNPRKFGRIWLVDDVEKIVGDLGPEPLSDSFTAEVLAERMRGRRGMIKPLLLNQRFIAGLGNIYVDESLFRAGLHPQRPVDTLVRDDIIRLHSAIQAVLRQALDHHGTSFDGVFIRPEGEQGRQQEGLAVYQQTGLPCVRCGSPIQKRVVGGRGTHFCLKCQPLVCKDL